MSGPEVRRLTPEELALAPDILSPEGWTFTVEELSRLHRLGGAVGAFDDGTMVGFLSFLDTPPVRWIGNVAVSPAARGHGLGTRLVQEALRGVRAGALYSVLKAVPLYDRLGFQDAGEVWNLRAERAVPQPTGGAEAMEDADVAQVVALDRSITGTDRTGLLHALRGDYPDQAFVRRRDGRVVAFGLAKVYGDVTEVGPIVAPDPADGAAVLDALLASAPGPYELVVLGENASAMEAARARGFERSFPTRLMFHGEPPAWRHAATFAAAGLEKG